MKKKKKSKRIKMIWGITLFVLLPIMVSLWLVLITEDGAQEVEYVAEEEVVDESVESQEFIFAKQLLDKMTLEERIYQMFIVTQEQLTGVDLVTQSGKLTKEAVEKYPVGGIIYFADNLISREQCIEMINNVQDYSKIGLFIAVDEEGGKVTRVGKNPEMGTTSFQSMETIGDSGDAVKAYEVGYTIGSELLELGFNLNFAPVADVFSNPDNTVIGDRAFSNNSQVAATMVAACVDGFKESGMACTLKHFPGHGDTENDSHYESVYINKSLEELYECELIPFQSGIKAGADFVMIGHINIPKVIEEDIPASLSKKVVTDLLRNELGFEGLIITDSMAMQAITEKYSSADAAVRAIQAGVDVILMPQNLEEAVDGVLNAVQKSDITEERINESVMKILVRKIQNGITNHEMIVYE